MDLKSVFRFAVFSLALCGMAAVCHSLAMIKDVGPNSRTIEFAAGTQENIHEVYFESREQFESMWPYILSQKTPEAPLRLSRVDPENPSTLLCFSRPTVRIYGPPGSGSRYYPAGMDAEAVEELNEEMLSARPEEQNEMMGEFQSACIHHVQGQWLEPGPPWPEDLVSENGALPEYVGAKQSGGKLRWMPADRSDKEVGFLVRARVEIELVVDGNIIDLNRIPLPENTPILDRRFKD